MKFLVIRSLPITMKNIQNVLVVEAEGVFDALNKAKEQEQCSEYNLTAFSIDHLKDGWSWTV